MLVIPNVMGIFTYSPPLDTWGNSSRGVEFCEVTLAFSHYKSMCSIPLNIRAFVTCKNSINFLQLLFYLVAISPKTNLFL